MQEQEISRILKLVSRGCRPVNTTLHPLQHPGTTICCSWADHVDETSKLVKQKPLECVGVGGVVV
jgi:ElaB/YqjD/DUF883 family membrane-anchored ribosome-binding protein